MPLDVGGGVRADGNHAAPLPASILEDVDDQRCADPPAFEGGEDLGVFDEQPVAGDRVDFRGGDFLPFEKGAISMAGRVALAHERLAVVIRHQSSNATSST